MNKNSTKTQYTKVPKLKVVTLRRHHSKAYRKRHIGLLLISLFVLFALIIAIIQYRNQIIYGFISGRDFIGGLFNKDSGKLYDIKIRSTFGFDVSFDQKQFYASAIDSKTGNLFIGNQLDEKRAYSVIRIAPNWIKDKYNQSVFTLTYHNDNIYSGESMSKLESIQNLALKDININESSVINQSTESLMIDNQTFLKTTWKLEVKNSSIPRLSSQIITYVGIVNGQLITIAIDGEINQTNVDVTYKDVISSLRFGSKEQAYIIQDKQVASNQTASRTLIDTLMFTKIASAASINTTDNLEKTAALYGPAVVKIYNAYCMDISIDGQPYVNNACDASFGSGFFINQYGNIATNGHVASADPKSIAIQFAFSSYADGDSQYLNFLLDIAGVRESDISPGVSDTELAALVIDKLYEIPDSLISVNNDVSNLLVCLTDKQPDTQRLIDDTNKRVEYTGQSSIKRAKLISSDYLAMDGIDGFRASDVAIIKINGSDYPTTKLGSIDDVRQGAELMILGFPGIATDNGVVESSINTVTLTMGKVSSKKNVSGSNNMVVETDATIGHGNSGGPAFADDGNVIGIATYTVDGSGKGNGVFNYIRDIKDLIRLANKSSISVNAASPTLEEWQKGIDNFYSSHYSKAVESFNKVKELYPYHSRVDEFIASANQRIEKGEDIKDFPTVLVSIIGVIVLGGVGVASFLIIRHKKHHEIYKNKLKAGDIQEFTPDIEAQHVVMSHNNKHN
jgi:S1-C subfamily serine protease